MIAPKGEYDGFGVRSYYVFRIFFLFVYDFPKLRSFLSVAVMSL